VKLTPLEQVRAELLQRLIERGPEQDETGNYRNALVDSARIEVLPTIFGETPEGVERADLVPALSIDGENISRSSYAMWLLRTRGEASWPHFVEHRVVFNEARRRGLEVSEADVLARTQDYIRRLILQDHQGSRESWVTQLQMRGNEEALFVHDLQVRMRVELLCERMMLLDRVITPEQVRLRFNDVYGEDGTAVQARLILINVTLERGPADETREQLERRITLAKQATRERAQALAQSVRDGGDFATLARQHSDEPSTKAQGGMLDSRFRPDRWPQPISDAVAALEVGGVTDAFEFGSAFALLQVVARDKVDFADIERELLEQMQLEPPPVSDLSLFRNALFQRAKVEVLEAMNPASK
jgi:hypothetical protein